MRYFNEIIKNYNQQFEKDHEHQIKKLSEIKQKVVKFIITGDNKYEMKIPPSEKIDCLSAFVKDNYGDIVDLLIPKHFIEDFYNSCDNFKKYQISRGYYRRSYRSNNSSYFLDNIFPLMSDYYLLGFLDTQNEGMKLFVCNEYEDDKKSVYSYIRRKENIIATRINAGDTNVIDVIKDMMTSENNTNILSYIVIRAVVMSENAELHDLLCKLLVAARLSEGLRQAICESADCGVTDSFKKILTTIKENDLIRFSSVKRSVGTWTGICRYGDPDRLAQKILDDAVYVVQSRQNCLDYINTTDAVHVFLGLWGLSFYDVQDTIDVISEITGITKNTTGISTNPIQLMTIGYFCDNVDINRLSKKISHIVLESNPQDYKLFSMYYSSYTYFGYVPRNPFRPQDKEQNFKVPEAVDVENAEKHYNILLGMFNAMPKKKIVFEQILFPWYSSEISKSDILNCMLDIAMGLDDDSKIEFLGSHISDFDTDSRSNVVDAVGEKLRTQKQREILINAIADKESSTRCHAVKIIKGITLTDEDYQKIELFAKYKTADLREGVIELLKSQSVENLKRSISRMVLSKDENIRLASLDLLIFGIANYTDVDFSAEKESALNIVNPSDREQILINEATSSNEDKKVLSAENGYGLYDPNVSISFTKIKPNIKIVKKYFSSVKIKDITQMYVDLLSIIDENANLEFRGWNGEERLLGNLGDLYCQWSRDYKEREKQKLHEVTPFRELWSEYYKKSIRTPERFHALYFILKQNRPQNLVQKSADIFQKNEKLFFGDIAEYDEKKYLYPKDVRFKNPAFFRTLESILACIRSEFELFNLPLEVVQNIVLYVARELKDNEIILERDTSNSWQSRFYKYTSSFFVSSAANQLKNLIDEDFETNFRILYELDLRNTQIDNIIKGRTENNSQSNYYNNNSFVDMCVYIQAYMDGIITSDNMYKVIFEVYTLPESFRSLGEIFHFSLYSSNIKIYNKILAKEGKSVDEDKRIPKESNLYKTVNEFLSVITDLVLNVELKRGDSETIFSKSITRISEIYGIERLIEILKALGNETLGSHHYYYYSGSISKKESLSHLLSVCMPNDDDSAEKLVEYIQNTKITNDRLIEVAMYAPQWMDIIEKYLKIDGFKSGCYYFMAHTAEYFSKKRLAMIAKYTPLTKDELNGGCFDVKWFREAYDTLGESIFNKIYKSAKYISSSNLHTRARKFADAALGKMDIVETEKIIDDKRNKDMLLSLAIIPSQDKSDILQRYEFIQKFLKESKQFGSQRRASESTAVEYALKNLAVTAGYSDDTRLVLSMETELVKSNIRYFDKTDINGYNVWIETDIFGKSTLKYEKNGKLLKSAPASIKKNDEYLNIKAFCDKLKNQYSRTVKMFENAMENREKFFFNELVMLCENPVTKAIIENLVFVKYEDNSICGFICGESGLKNANGDLIKIDKTTALRVAHPFDLYKNNVWSDYQKVVLDMGKSEKRKQPFRQVFRELYVKLPEELDNKHSLMFAGNQIQPAKTVATLKTRRWVADYENGLQKIYYDDNIIAEIYAVADWFSPSDIEAPVIEYVVFSDRKNYNYLKISEVPDIIYSEIMRDVDLAVSVAHSGGVDPETSHSTIEMRSVIIKFNLELFGIKNVSIDKNHAFIDGKHGKYTIHLGSGVIHKVGGHQINVVSVSSGSNSKIFLPFVDEDPKTAEIMTKIITFAQDDKIKDPFIMEQIKN